MDFNTASTQRSFDLIPIGTIANVHLTIRPGGAGNAGWLKSSKDGQSQALDCELTVVDGEFAHRKLWSLMTVQGTTRGHEDAAEITGSRIRAILESACNIRPDDMSEAATKARCIHDYEELDGLRFVAKIGIEKPRKEDEGRYQPKNCLLEVITPDRSAYRPIVQVKPTASSSASAKSAPAAMPAAIAKPAWAE
jgi:hypothetical protein